MTLVRLSGRSAPAVLALVLAACAAPVPPATLLRMPLAAPAALAEPTPALQRVAVQWMPLQLADHLDREALVWALGPGTLQRADHARWAEPLRDAIPRLLRHDLAQLLGPDRVWTAPLPEGVALTHKLRLALDALDLQQDRRTVRLQARWTLAGTMPPVSGQANFTVQAVSAGLGDVVLAHRQALAQLAVRMAASLPVAAR